MIDALEERDVAITNVAGTFLKANMPDFVLLQLQGSSLQAKLCANKKRYEKYVVYENGKPFLYVRLFKAMCGTLKAALLWYKMLSDTLENEGFILNKYNPCLANKIINGKQFTICCHVDDLKLSHEDPNEITKMIDISEKHFGKMNVKRGKPTYIFGHAI